MASLAQPARTLVDPVDGVAVAVENARFGLPMVAAMVTGCLASVAYFLRWDSATHVIGELTASGELQRSTESEIAEKILTAQRVALIGGLGKAIFLTPLLMLLLAVALKLTAWLLGRSAPFARCFTAGALAFLPLSVGQLALALVTLRQAAVSASQMAILLPSNLAALWPSLPPVASRAASAVDFFSLWSAAVLGLGFSAASGMSRRRGVAVGLLLYAMYVGVFVIGMAGMRGGGP
ncbi:MAG TPA: YIP1 family protein [Myxococcales bacterium]|nr:YIP1 family protein [Myxococcales bacterium]